MVIAELTPLSREALPRRYVRPPQPIHFPESEEMPETNRHMELRTALYQILKHELASRATVGSEQFVYYDPRSAKRNLAPDAFFKLGAPHEAFRIWKTWERGAPDAAVEVVSDSDEAKPDWDEKLERYASCGVGEVVRFDPDDTERPIRVWDHVKGDLVEREASRDGAFECVSLGLFWVAVPHRAFGQILRLARDREGRDLLPTPVEAEARARELEARARELEARARTEAERARDEEARARTALEAEVAELRKKLAERASTGESPPRKKRRSPDRAPASSRSAAAPAQPRRRRGS